MKDNIIGISSRSNNLPINEIFATIQGEASFTGTPSIFIRLQGCSVGCVWCDTKHTWELNQNQQIRFGELAEKKEDTSNWSIASTNQIVDYINKYFKKIKHVVITGGEPSQYDLKPLCHELEILGKHIQLETSATEELKISLNTWVTASPKLNMPGGKSILKSAIERANEIKMPIGKPHDIIKLKNLLNEFAIDSNQIKVWLQPISQNPTATKLCIREAIINNWQVSIQAHKYLNIP